MAAKNWPTAPRPAGLGLVAAPVGAYVIRDGHVRWLPAVDVNRLFVVAAVTVGVVLVTKARRHRAAQERHGDDRA